MLALTPHDPPMMSAAPLAHQKLNMLPVVDMEPDRLARACGQGPSFSTLYSKEDEQLDDSRWAGPSRALRSGECEELTSLGWKSGNPPWDYAEVFTSIETWGLRPRARSVRVPTRFSTSYLPARPRSASQPSSIPVFAPSSPRSVLRSLRELMDRDNVRMEECLGVQRVLERWAAQQRSKSQLGLECLGVADGVSDSKTFGSPVRVAVKCASMVTVLGGYQHPIPWVVYACVEELNRTGIYQPGLFRSVPHRSRLAKLIAGFDCPLLPSAESSSAAAAPSPCPPMAPTASITRASLRKESMPDICALLKTYLDLLPEPLLEDNLCSALHQLCVQPTVLREQREAEDERQGKKQERRHSNEYFFLPPRPHPPSPARPRCDSLFAVAPILMTPSERRSAALSLETTQVLIAQHLIRLAPPPLCALFAYLCGFFTQLPLSPDNGITLEDVSRMFGQALAGGSAATRHAVLMWVLERWVRISDGLFDIGSGAEGDGVESAPSTAYAPTFPASILPGSGIALRHEKGGSAFPPPTRRHSIVSSDGSASDSVVTFASSLSGPGVEVEDLALAMPRTPFAEPGSLPAVKEHEWEDQPGSAERSEAGMITCGYFPELVAPAVCDISDDYAPSDLFAVHEKTGSEAASLHSACGPPPSPPASECDSGSASVQHSRTSSAAVSRCSPPLSPLSVRRDVTLANLSVSRDVPQGA